MSRSSPLSTQPAAAAMQRDSRRWLALIFIAMGQLLLALDATIMNVALPRVQLALGFSDAVRPWVIGAYLVPFALLLLPGGRLADALGHKRALSLALLVFGLASAWGGAARDSASLLEARVLQGAAAALLAPSALSLVAVLFQKPDERARAFGLFGGVAACGGALGLVLGGALVRFVDYRWCLYTGVVVAALARAGVALTLDAPAHAPARGSALHTIVGLLQDRTRRAAAGVAALAVAAMSGAFLLLTYYFQVVRGASPLQTGLAFLPLSLGGMSGSMLIARRLLPRIAPRWLVVGALGVAATGLSLVACLQVEGSYLWPVLPGLVLLGVGIGCTMMPVFNLATLGVEPRNAGLASALLNTAQQLGGALGAALSSGVAARVSVARLAALQPSAAALVDGYRAAATVGVLLLLLAIGAASFLVASPEPARP